MPLFGFPILKNILEDDMVSFIGACLTHYGPGGEN